MSDELTMTNEEAQRHIEQLMAQYNLRGLVWGEIDLRARVDEVLDESDREYILPEGVTREDVVKRAQELPAWHADAWLEGDHNPWNLMAEAVEEAFIDLCGPATER